VWPPLRDHRAPVGARPSPAIPDTSRCTRTSSSRYSNERWTATACTVGFRRAAYAGIEPQQVQHAYQRPPDSASRRARRDVGGDDHAHLRRTDARPTNRSPSTATTTSASLIGPSTRPVADPRPSRRSAQRSRPPSNLPRSKSGAGTPAHRLPTGRSPEVPCPVLRNAIVVCRRPQLPAWTRTPSAAWLCLGDDWQERRATLLPLDEGGAQGPLTSSSLNAKGPVARAVRSDEPTRSSRSVRRGGASPPPCTARIAAPARTRSRLTFVWVACSRAAIWP
jgi:hypothetical protein